MSTREMPVVMAPEGLVPFPGVIIPLELAGESALKLLSDVRAAEGRRLVVAVRHPDEEEPQRIAVEAQLLRVQRRGEGAAGVLVQGLHRVELGAVVRKAPYLVMESKPIEEQNIVAVETVGLEAAVRDLTKQLMKQVPDLPDEVRTAVDMIKGPSALADAGAFHIDMPHAERVELLQQTDVGERLRKLLPLVARQIEVHKVRADIESQVKKEMGKNQREFVLRQRLKAIQQELGDDEDGANDVEALRERLEKAELPEEAAKAARQQLGRLQQMQAASPEYQVTRNYLEWLADLPWSKTTPDRIDLVEARRVLDEDHNGLEKVKRRVVEFLAVRKLAPEKRGPILCLVGPPGVGKTSLGRSIARTLGRQYVRISLGGVRDEAEVRGHRRTYVGALPGRIIQGLKRAGSKNPVFVLDEIDKLGSDFRGDPSAALLEVLDPEQNSSFSDHYLELPFDLSKVMFIATANQLDTIPAPLRDRMEVIEVPGYTQREKLAIAREHLLPRQLAEHGLTAEQLTLDNATITALIEGYTREAGVRELERQLGALCRAAAVETTTGAGPLHFVETDLSERLGPPRYHSPLDDRPDQPGVTTGLAWTPSGGEVLFIEATRMPGKGKLVLTGQLGEVMKESAQAAMSYARAHAGELGIDPGVFERSDVHVHVPAGAVPKDGPSAGVALLTTLVSLLTGRAVRPDVAMTGEVTLRGRVLPVGGIKEKVLAAHRAGVTTVFLPDRNRKDAVDVPEDVRAALDIRFVDKVGDVLDEALTPAEPALFVPPVPAGPAGGLTANPSAA